MSNYANSPQCKMLQTKCCICNRPLVDSISVQLGIGPECRKDNNAGISKEVQDRCNQLTHRASVAAQEGSIEAILGIANAIEKMGLGALAEKIRRRFVNVRRNIKITIDVMDGEYIVKTPFKRSRKEEFIAAMRSIPGRYYRRIDKANIIPLNQRERLWGLLQEFFVGDYGHGPKGIFRIVKEKNND